MADFSPSVLPRLLVNLKDTMSDSRVQQKHALMPDYGIIELIKKIETAEFMNVRPQDATCREYAVSWMQEPNTKATANTNVARMDKPLCTITGETLDSFKKTYELKKSISHSVSILDDDCGNMFDTGSKVSLALLQTFKKIITGLAEALPPQLYAYAGENIANSKNFNGNIGEPKTGNALVTEIQREDLIAEKTIPYLILMSKLNKLQNPGVIDGGLLFLDNLKAKMQDGTNAGDTGNANYWNLLSRYELDMINMMESGYGDYAFVIDQGNLSLPIVTFFPRLGEGNEVRDGKYIYSVPIPGFTILGEPVYVDMTYTKAEVTIAGTNRCTTNHIFHIELKYDLWQAPKYTTDTVTGIIALQQAELV